MSGGRVWFHAASLGDQAAVQPLVRRASEAGLALTRSAVTRSGRQRAQALSPEARHVRAPLLWGARGAILREGASLRLIALELLELWPHWVRHAERLGVPVAVVNGRIGAGTMRAGPLLRASFERLSLFLAQTERDAVRAHALGVRAERVHVCGNSKYDMLLSVAAPPEAPQRRPVRLCLGALRPEDERALLRCPELLEGLSVLIAPRYLERSSRLIKRLTQAGLCCQRRSAHPELSLERWLEEYSPQGPLILDSYGELKRAYWSCELAVIGGSFGGRPQSLIEAALAGCALGVGRGVAGVPLERAALMGHAGELGESRGVSGHQSLKGALRWAHTATPLSREQLQLRSSALESLTGAAARQWAHLERLMG